MTNEQMIPETIVGAYTGSRTNWSTMRIRTYPGHPDLKTLKALVRADGFKVGWFSREALSPDGEWRTLGVSTFVDGRGRAV